MDRFSEPTDAEARRNAADAVAYYEALPVPELSAGEELSALDQMYAYYSPLPGALSAHDVRLPHSPDPR